MWQLERLSALFQYCFCTSCILCLERWWYRLSVAVTSFQSYEKWPPYSSFLALFLSKLDVASLSLHKHLCFKLRRPGKIHVSWLFDFVSLRPFAAGLSAKVLFIIHLGSIFGAVELQILSCWQSLFCRLVNLITLWNNCPWEKISTSKDSACYLMGHAQQHYHFDF